MDEQMVAVAMVDCKPCRLGIEAELRAITDRLRVPVVARPGKALVIDDRQPSRMFDQEVDPPRNQLLTEGSSVNPGLP